MDNSIYKKCTECGQTKHISEFSKSYPNRCKTCVAEHTRQMRAAEWGANWRINSVWHDAKECPERKRNYLAQCKNGRFNVIPDSMNWDNFYKKAEIIRWAYIEDLLPNMED